jgi:hypothetical protein
VPDADGAVRVQTLPLLRLEGENSWREMLSDSVRIVSFSLRRRPTRPRRAHTSPRRRWYRTHDQGRRGTERSTAMEKLRIVTVGFGHGATENP